MPFFLLQALRCLTTTAGMTKRLRRQKPSLTLLTELGLSLLDGGNEHISSS